MDHLQKINEQLEKLKYLDGTKEKNLQILNNRVKEINEEKRKGKRGMIQAGEIWKTD